MALPLPRVVPDVGPGGGVVNALSAINALSNAMHERKINQVKAQYAPLTTQADAASKLAYANLVAPQFISKLLGNEGALASLSESQKKALLDRVYNAGTMPSPLNQLNNMPQHTGIGQPSTNNFSGVIKNALRGLFGTKSQGINNLFAQPSQTMPQQQQAPQIGMPESSVNNMGGNRPKNGVTVEGQQWYDQNGNPVYAEEEQVKEPGSNAMELELTQGQVPKKERTWAEKKGDFLGVVKEGEELGKIRATSKKELDQDYQQALQMKQPIDLLGKIISNPRFQNLRNLPGFQKLQMNAKANFGTPEEKKLIGEFQAAARQVVSATVKGFGGRILASEIPLSESMKLSDNDSIEAMLGKEPIIKSFNEMTLQRAKIASKLIKEYHLDKGEALEQADKMVDGEAIRKKAEMELNPISEEDIAETARANKMTREQVIKRLKAEGRYNG